MASKYYNPRLASIAGAAQGKPYISSTPNIEKAFAKFDRVLEIKRREKIQQQKENDKALADIYYTTQKFLQNLYKEEKNIPEKHKAGLLQGYARQLKEMTMKSKDPNIARADSLLLQQTAFSNLNKIDNSYKKISDALKPTAELIKNKKYDANLVDPEALKNFKKLVEGSWIVDSYGDDGYEKIKFEGSEEAIDINSAIESASLIPDQSELHSTISKNMIDAAEEFEKSDYPIDVFKDKINNEILSGQLDYKTALSLAGKIGLGGENNIDLKRLALASREDNDFTYEDVEIDENGNFNSTGKVISGEDGLIEAVKDHYRKTAANYAKQFETQRVENEKPEITKPTATEQKEIQTQKNIAFATNELNKMKLPKTSKGMIDVGSTLFNTLLSDLNLSANPKGSLDANGKQLIEVKSNLTNKTLNFTSNMTKAQFNRAVLLLSGASPEEAMKKYPDNQGPVEENEVINIGSLPVKK
jgi:hypothetical protein